MERLWDVLLHMCLVSIGVLAVWLGIFLIGALVWWLLGILIPRRQKDALASAFLTPAGRLGVLRIANIGLGLFAVLSAVACPPFDRMFNSVEDAAPESPITFSGVLKGFLWVGVAVMSFANARIAGREKRRLDQ